MPLGKWEAPKPGETRPPESYLRQPEALAEVKNEIKNNLLKLIKRDDMLEYFGYQVKAILDNAKILITQLKKEHPNDPDLYVLEKIYSDLQGDFEREEETEIDKSFKEMLEEMGSLMREAGVVREKLNETILSEQVATLQSLGINPEYVVTSGNSDAPVIVLFKQIHGNPGMSQEVQDVIGVSASQDEIKQAISKALDANLIDTVYDEGVAKGEVLSTDAAKKHVSETGIRSASSEIKSERTDQITIRGYDVDELKNTTGIHDPYRMTSHNVLIASNLSESVQNTKKPISFLSIGGGHENLRFLGFKKNHPLPLSSILAYYGLNVIVVDATEYFDKEKVLAKMAELEQVAAKMPGKGMYKEKMIKENFDKLRGRLEEILGVKNINNELIKGMLYQLKLEKVENPSKFSLDTEEKEHMKVMVHKFLDQFNESISDTEKEAAKRILKALEK